MNPLITFQHLDKKFTLTNNNPQLPAPGKGLVNFKNISLSANSILKDETLTISAEIEGEKIAHIFVEVYLCLQGQSIGPLYQEYCLASQNKEIGGVTYPVWGEKITISQVVPLTLPVLNSGEQITLGFAGAEKYTLTDSERTYRMNGVLALQNGTETYKARARFDAGGTFMSMTAVKEHHGKGFSREVSLKPGDTFRPLVKIMPISPMDGGIDFLADLVNADPSMRRTTLPPLTGKYDIGLRVQDLDGNFYQQFEHLDITAG